MPPTTAGKPPSGFWAARRKRRARRRAKEPAPVGRPRPAPGRRRRWCWGPSRGDPAASAQPPSARWKRSQRVAGADDRGGLGAEPPGAQRQDAPRGGGGVRPDGPVGALGGQDLAHQVAGADRARVDAPAARATAPRSTSPRPGPRVAPGRGAAEPRGPPRARGSRPRRPASAPGGVGGVGSAPVGEASAARVLGRRQVVQGARQRRGRRPAPASQPAAARTATSSVAGHDGRADPRAQERIRGEV